ncbi:MAG: hypothetical protein MJ223_02925 [Mycoplasmoidaceae bacterium]|nr:hypothetical protein [Mycoplasmoidaceae bacterium]
MTNGSYVGSGLAVAKEAKVDDGEMTVSCIEKFCRLNTLNVLTKVKSGKIAKVKKRYVFNCKEINIDGENLNLEYDGNIIKGLKHINVKTIPGKIKLLSVKKGK